MLKRKGREKCTEKKWERGKITQRMKKENKDVIYYRLDERLTDKHEWNIEQILYKKKNKHEPAYMSNAVEDW